MTGSGFAREEIILSPRPVCLTAQADAKTLRKTENERL
jgi:hypothetical protein